MGIMEMARRAAARPTYKDLKQQNAELLSALGLAIELSEVLLECCDADLATKMRIRNQLDIAKRGFNAYMYVSAPNEDMTMAELEGEDHKVTRSEREFWRSLTIVIQHLSDRALVAEAEVKRLRAELQTRNEQVEYMGSADRTCATCHAVLAPGAQPSATYERQ